MRGRLRFIKIETTHQLRLQETFMSTETVKKAKAPAKPKAVKTPKGETGSVVTAAPKVAAKAKAAPKSNTVDMAASRTPSYAEIAQLAERYWAERGWQDGYAEQDWLRAEQELLGMAS
jgi:hypothetical protein